MLKSLYPYCRISECQNSFLSQMFFCIVKLKLYLYQIMIFDKTLIIFNSCYLKRGKRNLLYCTWYIIDTGGIFCPLFYIFLHHTNFLPASSLNHCCGSGSGCESGRIRNILTDPDRYQFLAKLIKYTFFPAENFKMLSKILKMMTSLTLMRKITIVNWQCCD